MVLKPTPATNVAVDRSVMQPTTNFTYVHTIITNVMHWILFIRKIL